MARGIGDSGGLSRQGTEQLLKLLAADPRRLSRAALDGRTVWIKRFDIEARPLAKRLHAFLSPGLPAAFLRASPSADAAGLAAREARKAARFNAAGFPTPAIIWRDGAVLVLSQVAEIVEPMLRRLARDGEAQRHDALLVEMAGALGRVQPDVGRGLRIARDRQEPGRIVHAQRRGHEAAAQRPLGGDDQRVGVGEVAPAAVRHLRLALRRPRPGQCAEQRVAAAPARHEVELHERGLRIAVVDQADDRKRLPERRRLAAGYVRPILDIELPEALADRYLPASEYERAQPLDWVKAQANQQQAADLWARHVLGQ